MEEPNNCPKPECGRPESTHRWSAGKRLSICGNGHSWNQVEEMKKKQKADEATMGESRALDSIELQFAPMKRTSM